MEVSISLNWNNITTSAQYHSMIIQEVQYLMLTLIVKNIFFSGLLLILLIRSIQQKMHMHYIVRHNNLTIVVLLSRCIMVTSPVNSPHKGQWRGALVFSFICPWINALHGGLSWTFDMWFWILTHRIQNQMWNRVMSLSFGCAIGWCLWFSC